MHGADVRQRQPRHDEPPGRGTVSEVPGLRHADVDVGAGVAKVYLTNRGGDGVRWVVVDDSAGVQGIVDGVPNSVGVGEVWACDADEFARCVYCVLVLLGVLRSLPLRRGDVARGLPLLLRADRGD